MNEQEKPDKTRRNLIVATSAVGAAAGLGAAVPFVWSMFPSERAKAAGGPVEVDLSKIAPGSMEVVEWRGKPVWIMRRTQEMLQGIKQADGRVADPKSEIDQQPRYAANEFRSIKPELLVLVGVCTHLGCSPQMKPADAKGEMGGDWSGGFYCPCHGSKFDLAGRVYRGSPAPTNLVVPPYQFVSDATLVIGEDQEKKGA